MDYTFIFKISKDSISINKTKRIIDEKGLNNTNIIDTKELRFSPEYIRENSDLVSTFLNVIILKNNITTCIINSDNHVEDLVQLVNGWDKITKLIFKQDITISFDVFMKILENNYLKTIECYNMPTYLMERIDMNKNIKVIMREKKHFASRFMNENMLSSYSDIYYKKSIIITDEYNEKELEVIKNFIAINNNLRTIRFIVFSNENIAVILNALKEYQKRNVTIIIDEKGNDLNVVYKTIPYLKKTYKKFMNDYGIDFKINYSFEYKKNNFFKEFNLRVLSTIILIVIFMVLTILGYNSYIEFKDEGIIEDQMSEITDILDQYTTLTPDDDGYDVVDPNGTTSTHTSEVSGIYYTNYSRVIDELININPDTVGWLKVNNTNIDYPVVQTTDNKYYLNRDFKKNKNSMGWIYMDHRNDPKNLNQNTIIYGHNVKAGVMFGTMYRVFNNSYFTRESNNYITLNTKDATMKFKIFSVYRTPTTTDYLQTEFLSKEEYRNFLELIRSRNQYNLDNTVNENDKILTLSTCHSNTTRNVIHAKLVEVTNNQAVETEPITESPTTVTEETTKYVGN